MLGLVRWLVLCSRVTVKVAGWKMAGLERVVDDTVRAQIYICTYCHIAADFQCTSFYGWNTCCGGGEVRARCAGAPVSLELLRAEMRAPASLEPEDTVSGSSYEASPRWRRFSFSKPPPCGRAPPTPALRAPARI